MDYVIWVPGLASKTYSKIAWALQIHTWVGIRVKNTGTHRLCRWLYKEPGEV